MDESMMDDEAVFAKLSDGVSDYFHGPAREHVADAMASPEGSPADTIATLTYQTLSQVSEKLQKSNPEMVSYEVLLSLATEAIDYLIEIGNAVGTPVQDEQKLREEALFKVVEIHIAKVGDDPEQRAMAQEALAEMMEDGTMDQAMSYVQRRLKEEGGDPAMIERGGQQLMKPKQNALSAGVQQGLLGSQQ